MNCISNVSKKVKKVKHGPEMEHLANVINLVCKNGLLYFEIQYLSDGEIFKADKNLFAVSPLKTITKEDLDKCS